MNTNRFSGVRIVSLGILLSLLVACQAAGTQIAGDLMTGDGSHAFTFTMDLPAEWVDKVTVNNLEHALSIHYNAEPMALLFTVSVMTDAEWQKAKNEVGAGDVLKTIDGVVFVINKGLDNPYTGSQGDEFQSMAAQIHDVIDSMSLKASR